VKDAVELALRTFDLNAVAFDLDGHAFRDDNRVLSNS
jgi:hypothetical protein